MLKQEFHNVMGEFKLRYPSSSELQLEALFSKAQNSISPILIPPCPNNKLVPEWINGNFESLSPDLQSSLVCILSENIGQQNSEETHQKVFLKLTISFIESQRLGWPSFCSFFIQLYTRRLKSKISLTEVLNKLVSLYPGYQASPIISQAILWVLCQNLSDREDLILWFNYFLQGFVENVTSCSQYFQNIALDYLELLLNAAECEKKLYDADLSIPAELLDSFFFASFSPNSLLSAPKYILFYY
jgi:hypothetical protein